MDDERVMYVIEFFDEKKGRWLPDEGVVHKWDADDIQRQFKTTNNPHWRIVEYVPREGE